MISGVGALPSDATPYLGRLWLGADGKVYRARYVFDNKGDDYLNCGRPAWLSSLRPTLDLFAFKIVASIGPASLNQYLFSLGLATRQFSVYATASGYISINVGGPSRTSAFYIANSPYTSIV